MKISIVLSLLIVLSGLIGFNNGQDLKFAVGRPPAYDYNGVTLTAVSGAFRNTASSLKVAVLYPSATPIFYNITAANYISDTVLHFPGEPQFGFSGTIVLCESTTQATCTLNTFSYNNIPFEMPSYVTAISSPTTEGGAVTITGRFLKNNIEGYDTEIAIDLPSVGLKSFPVTTNDIGTEAYFSLPDEYGGSNLNFSLSVRGSPSKRSMYFNYQKPTITGHVLGSDSQITINGASFGKSNTNSLIQVNGVKVMPLDINHNRIIIPLTTNFQHPSSNQIILNVFNQQSDPYIILIKPVLSSVSSAPKAGGQVTINGSFLYLTRADGSPAEVAVNIGTIPCTNPQQFGDGGTGIICDITGGNSKDLKVTVSIDKILSTETNILFTYGIPHINSIVQEGTTFTITGYSLGSTAVSSVSLNKGSGISPTSVDGTNKVLVFTLPADNKNGKITVKNDVGTSNEFNINLQPIIDTISLSQTKGSTVTITGKYLNTKDFAGNDINTTVTVIDSGACTNVRGVDPPTSVRILCDAPAGIGKGHRTYVTSAGLNSYEQSLDYNKPVLISTYQSLNTIRLVGTDLGDSSADTRVRYFGAEFDTVNITVPHTEAAFYLPNNASSGAVTVIVAGQESNPLDITLLPTIVNVTSISTVGGQITVFANFIHTQEEGKDIIITIGNFSCSNITLIGDGISTIVCEVPRGTGAYHMVNISVAGNHNPDTDPIVYFNYLPPTVTECTNSNEKGGLITIYGNSFDTNNIQVMIGIQECQRPDVYEGTKIVCYLPKWNFDNGEPPESNQYVNVTVDGQSGGQNIFSYDLAGYFKEKRDAAKKKKLTWLVPAILIPALVGVVAIVALTIVLVKRHNKLKKLRKMFRNNQGK